MELSPLVARIGLSAEVEDLGRDFYVGPRRLSGFDHPVVSWDAPVAKVFFQPEVGHGELNDCVAVRRTLVARSEDIVKFYDEETPALHASDFPFVQRKLRVPSAPAPSARRRAESAAPRGTVPAAAVPSGPSHPAAAGLEAGMRAVDAVKDALAAPRAEALTSVLSTLQPDQYDLVTRPPEVPLLIQGHPGTGKTIVGLHRAAFLVGEQRPTRQVSRVLLLGPTEEYVRHVSRTIEALDLERRVTIKSLPQWMRELSGIKHELGGGDPRPEDVAQFVKLITDRSARLCRQQQPWATGGASRKINLKRLYDVIRARGTAKARLKTGTHSGPWINTLPTFEKAFGLKRYLPLFAQAALSIRQVHEQWDHVIVDEAQDVSGLEWEIIRAHNLRAGWTLLGDMNQRRHDLGDATWESLSNRLSLRVGPGMVQPVAIERGYRSTQQILDFAKPLLPRQQRTAQSLQRTGPEPTVTRVHTARAVGPMVVAEATRLLIAHQPGTVAIITVDEATVVTALLAQGWRRAERGDWAKDGRLLALRTPESARGVEFDGVVVVEPGAFPRNLGRVGPLYTSLTRANRELSVVHFAALPDALRHHGRRS